MSSGETAYMFFLHKLAADCPIRIWNNPNPNPNPIHACNHFKIGAGKEYHLYSYSPKHSIAENKNMLPPKSNPSRNNAALFEKINIFNKTKWRLERSESRKATRKGKAQRQSAGNQPTNQMWVWSVPFLSLLYYIIRITKKAARFLIRLTLLFCDAIYSY